MKPFKKTISEFKLQKVTTDMNSVKITRSLDSVEFMRQFWGCDIDVYESFFLITLNRANNVTGYVKISQGGCYGTVVDIKLIAKFSLDSLAAAVIIAHNHPSGNLKPSEQDIQITRKIKDALNLFDVQVIDHCILTAEAYYSFADHGVL
jgi:DNA repair protein RadC